MQLSYGPQGLKLISARTVVPVKGTPDSLRVISGVSKEDAARKRQGIRIVSIGTNCCKAEIFDLLRHALPTNDGSPSPGCYHFPLYDMTYFEGLTSEVKLVKPNGDVTYEKRGARNEPVDLAVYNRAAAAIVGIDRMSEEHWRRFEQAVMPMTGPATPRPALAAPAPPQAAPAPSIQPGQPRRSGFFRRD
jgi:phage terminase large subunit GpA-like protein